MKRYVTKAKSAEDWDYAEARPPVVSMMVSERSPEPVFTGLYDAAGNQLFSVDELDPIGFVRFK